MTNPCGNKELLAAVKKNKTAKVVLMDGRGPTPFYRNNKKTSNIFKQIVNIVRCQKIFNRNQGKDL